MNLPRPTPGLCAWGAAVSSLFLLPLVHPGLGAVPWLGLGALLLLFAADAALAARGGVVVRRRLPGALALDRPFEAVLEVESGAGFAREVRLTDDLHPGLEGNCLPISHAVLPGETLTVAFPVTARRRGEHLLGPVHARVEGPLGLSLVESSHAAGTTVRVFPDMAPVSSWEALLVRSRTRTAGMQATRGPGAGGEFDSLRDFLSGDDPRKVDWKTSRRRSRLTTRLHVPERQQEVLILLDTGRLMTSEWERRARIEASIQAAAMLSWVVMRSHDAVGIVTFSHRVHEALKPVSGPRAVGRIREVLLRAEADLTEPDYREAFSAARSLLGKRALILLFSDPVGTSMAGEIRREFTSTGRRHLNGLVTMRDPEVWRRASAPVRTPEEAALRAAAESHVQERQVALAKLRQAGVLLVDAFPADLTAAAVNRYLQLKAGRLL